MDALDPAEKTMLLKRVSRMEEWLNARARGTLDDTVADVEEIERRFAIPPSSSPGGLGLRARVDALKCLLAHPAPWAELLAERAGTPSVVFGRRTAAPVFEPAAP